MADARQKQPDRHYVYCAHCNLRIHKSIAKLHKCKGKVNK